MSRVLGRSSVAPKMKYRKYHQNKAARYLATFNITYNPPNALGVFQSVPLSCQDALMLTPLSFDRPCGGCGNRHQGGIIMRTFVAKRRTGSPAPSLEMEWGASGATAARRTWCVLCRRGTFRPSGDFFIMNSSFFPIILVGFSSGLPWSCRLTFNFVSFVASE